MVRGAIRALTVPTPLSEVWSLLQRELRQGDDASSGVVPGLFQTVLNGIIAAGEVSGALRGGGSSWIPVVRLRCVLGVSHMLSHHAREDAFLLRVEFVCLLLWKSVLQ